MKHTPTVTRFQGRPAELAEALGDLYYDSLANHLKLLSEKMARDSVADAGRSRHKLAGELKACANHLSQAAGHIERAWAICRPHVNEQ
jgi:hypothetical protein